MQDRQPGKPGQYKAILTATEFQKMQAGQQFTITMIRDDQPIVEGTPYSKAAVLPDDLANIICPNLDNPTPADALRAHVTNKSNPHEVSKSQVGLGNVPNVATNDQTPTYEQTSTLSNLVSGEKLSVSFGKIMKAIADLIAHLANKSNPHDVTAADVGARPNTWMPTAADVGAAPAGYGYGESMQMLNYESKDELLAALNTMLAAMPYDGRKQIAIASNGLLGYTYTFYCTLTRAWTGYSTLEGFSYDGARFDMYQMGGTWSDVRWINPSMWNGVEYLTPKKHEGKAVYRKRIKHAYTTTVGAASGYADSVITDRTTMTSCVAVNARVDENGEEFQLPYVSSSGGITMITKCNNSGIVVRTWNMTWTNPTFYVEIEYTKD